MPIDSSSTPEDIINAYMDNVGYDGDGSVESARIFVKATRIVIATRPQSTSGNGHNINWDMNVLNDQLKHAVNWLQANDPNSGNRSEVRHLDLTGFRR